MNSLWEDVLAGDELFFIMGPCVIEDRSTTIDMAYTLRDIRDRYGIPLIFKSSYDKANRSSVDSYRGPGIEQGLAVLDKVKRETGLPVTTDVHNVDEVPVAAEVVDLLQIPAFLCRQTDLLLAAGKTGLPVNVKKGQFMAPWDMNNTARKILSTGNDQIVLTERGATFGYNNLVVDMRSIPIMRSLGYPVVFDATHSVQLPSAGDRAYDRTAGSSRRRGRLQRCVPGSSQRSRHRPMRRTEQSGARRCTGRRRDVETYTRGRAGRIAHRLLQVAVKWIY